MTWRLDQNLAATWFAKKPVAEREIAEHNHGRRHLAGWAASAASAAAEQATQASGNG